MRGEWRRREYVREYMKRDREVEAKGEEIKPTVMEGG